MDNANIILGLKSLTDYFLCEGTHWRRMKRVSVYVSLALDSELSTLLYFFAGQAFHIFRYEAITLLEIGTCGCGR